MIINFAFILMFFFIALFGILYCILWVYLYSNNIINFNDMLNTYGIGYPFNLYKEFTVKKYGKVGNVYKCIVASLVGIVLSIFMISIGYFLQG